MGISCSEGGKTWVTDDDHIEKSNLSRQFLFRNHMIKHSKSKMAAEVVQKMNPSFNIVAMQDRVSALTEKVFDVPFWTDLTCVVNALDNLEARLYVDRRCIFFKKPMFDSGTLGPKFNTQVVLPYKTEHYGARRDPVEKQAPDCTLHNFPHNINHCLSWGRSEFIGNFEKIPGDVLRLFELGSAKAYIEERQKLHVGEREIMQDSKAIHEFLVSRRCSSFAECVAWARERYEDYFVNRIHQLVFNLPEDATTSTGMKFWSPPKRFPHPADFDPEDPIKMQFIVASANLMAKVSGVLEPSHPGVRDVESVRKILDGVIVPEFAPCREEIETSEDSGSGVELMDGSHTVDERMKLLDEALSFRGPKLTPHPEEFEKDDDTNFHMDFISSVGNLRARSYAIGEVDKLQAKLIAGRIIPAIATATACATGLVCFELYKLINECELGEYRMGFCNLAIPTFTACEPSEPAKNLTRDVEERPDPINYPDYVEEKTIHAHPEGFTIWDSIEVRMPLSVTLGGFLKFFDEKHGIHPTSVSVSPDPSRAILIYSDYMDRTKPRLEMTMHHIYEEIGHMDVDERPYILPSIVFEDKNGDDVETPEIVHYFRMD
jgi:ubiquitin-activating enzyme E1